MFDLLCLDLKLTIYNNQEVKPLSIASPFCKEAHQNPELMLFAPPSVSLKLQHRTSVRISVTKCQRLSSPTERAPAVPSTGEQVVLRRRDGL